MNTNIVPNLIIYLLVKFQPYPICVAKDIDKIPPLCFLKNCNSREVETEFFTVLTSESDFELNTNVVVREII